MTEENRVIEHLLNMYDGPAGENPKENSLNENKPTAAGYKITVSGYWVASSFYAQQTSCAHAAREVLSR